ncbi:hypothetical protein BCR36DRAFT_68057 [Piromyces finnis]|uniref:Uncharacterized protein n=1 Tax=Piromyces finnis TaxID=1754191 RepID=A0A1Y1V7P3_9FUNG|nr:hypothetical protein BCR36DRAFT_68057 [Piromyces finnis]|eukprot:ORX49316.1 hypothetical protein BCR36DRAFT_68057 [Piromyces finnis]
MIQCFLQNFAKRRIGIILLKVDNIIRNTNWWTYFNNAKFNFDIRIIYFSFFHFFCKP